VLHFDVGFSQVHVDLGHIERRMPQDQLEGHHIAAIHEIVHRKGMPEQMGMKACDAGGVPQPLDGLGKPDVR
jgi:uncharacterized protein YprB with RNaseH-like and TPR domain